MCAEGYTSVMECPWKSGRLHPIVVQGPPVHRASKQPGSGSLGLSRGERLERSRGSLRDAKGMSVAYVCCCGKNRNEVDRDSVEAEVQEMWKRPRGIVWRDRDDFWRALCT